MEDALGLFCRRTKTLILPKSPWMTCSQMTRMTQAKEVSAVLFAVACSLRMGICLSHLVGALAQSLLHRNPGTVGLLPGSEKVCVWI